MDRFGYISSDELTVSWYSVYYSCTVVVHTVQCSGHTLKVGIMTIIIITVLISFILTRSCGKCTMNRCLRPSAVYSVCYGRSRRCPRLNLLNNVQATRSKCVKLVPMSIFASGFDFWTVLIVPQTDWLSR